MGNEYKFNEQELEIIESLEIEDESIEEKLEQIDLFNRLFKIDGCIYYWSKKRKQLYNLGNKVCKASRKLVVQVKKDTPNQITKEHITKTKTHDVLKNELILIQAELDNVINEIEQGIDVFAEDNVLIRANKTLKMTMNSFYFQDYRLLKETTKKDYEEIIKDYKEHFEELDEVLKWIVSCFFTENRRDSFFYTLVNAGWGKSFFMGVLKELKLVYQMKYTDFKSPCGVKPEYLSNVLGIVIDEFKKYKEEFKELTNEISIEPKFGYRATIKIYAKLFFSAEKSDSFNGGITKQITDRVLINDKRHKDIESLEHRLVYKNKGNAMYFNAVAYYINQELQKYFNEYKEMGKVKADKDARSHLDILNEKYTIKSAKTIEEDVKERLFENIKDIVLNSLDTNSVFDRRETMIMKNHIEIIYDSKDRTTIRKIGLKKPDRFYEDFLKEQETSFAKKATYLNIFDLFGQKAQSHRNNTETFNGMCFNWEDITDKNIERYEHPRVTLVNPDTDEEAELLF